MSKTIVTITNMGYSKDFDLESYGKDKVTFGSGNCDIIINNQKLSANHGTFYRYNGTWYLQDENSVNGILVNNVKISTQELKNGDRIILGKSYDPDAVSMTFKFEKSFMSFEKAASSLDGGPAAPANNTPGSAAPVNNTPSSPTPAMTYPGGTQRTNSYQSGSGSSGGYQSGSGSSGGYQSGNYPSRMSPPVNSRPAPAAPASAPKKMSTGTLLGIISIGLIVIIMIVGAIFLFGGKDKDDEDSTKAAATTETTTEATTEATTEVTTEAVTEEDKELSGQEIYALASPSTVEIIAYVSDGYGSLGTGFYIDEDGTVATNYHVIDGATQATITTSDGKEYKVTGILGYDKDVDVAILSTEATNTTPLEKRTDEVLTGETVYALGNPKGFTSTISEGNVSQAEREENGNTYIQHSAPISNGSSGGPLLDTKGRVIGINTMMYTDGQNLNFALPISVVDDVDMNSSKSFDDVITEQGGTVADDGSEVDTTDWTDTYDYTVAGKTIKMTLPEGFSESSPGTINYTDSNGVIAVNIAAQNGDYASVTEEELQAMDGMFIDKMKEEIQQYFDGDIEVDSAAGEINGETWRIYKFSGESNSKDMNAVVMLNVSDDTLIVVTAMTYATGDTGEELENTLIGIMSTVEVE